MRRVNGEAGVPAVPRAYAAKEKVDLMKQTASQYRKLRGSMTVELAIILPVILIVIVGVLRTCMTHYQRVMISTAAMQAAARGAAYWDVIGANGVELESVPNPDYKHHDPYRYLLDGHRAAKLENIRAYTANLIGSRGEGDYGDNAKLMSGASSKITVEKKGLILTKRVSVSVTRPANNPIAPLLERLGIHVPTSITITAEAPLNTPAEFIRNISFIYDLVQEKG